MLRPEHPTMKPIVVDPQRAEFRILGKVTGSSGRCKEQAMLARGAEDVGRWGDEGCRARAPQGLHGQRRDSPRESRVF